MQAIRMLRTLAWRLVVVPLLLGMVSLAGGGPSPLNEEAAIAAYAKAAKAVGIAQGGEKPTVSKPEERMSGGGATVGSVRKVHSPQLTVDVDAYSGKIVRVVNKTAWEKSDARVETAREQGKGVGPTRSLKLVIDAAENYCRALGQNLPPDLGLRIMEFDDKQGCWYLAWVRRVNGYLFDEENLGIRIDDQTGGLAHYINRVTEITCGTEVRVPKEKARAIAHDQVSRILPALVHNQSFEFEEDQEPKLCIVYQNDAMRRSELMTDLMRRFKTMPPPPDQLPPPAEKLPPRARLVYAIRFGLWYVGKEKWHVDRGPVTIWVDAANGEVVGGIT
ncbi:MAG: hypothetical protein NTX87_20115 [Planctomycetota bacterium]|nr:hypothetical protein [Planctomycetota bacterium]